MSNFKVEKRTMAFYEGSNEEKLVEWMQGLHFWNVESRWEPIVETATGKHVFNALLISAYGLTKMWDLVVKSLGLNEIRGIWM